MRGSAIAASLALLLTAMSAVPVFAQPAPAPARPAQPAPAQPAATAPTQAPPQAAPPVQPPAPFPAAAKVAYFNPQAVFQASAQRAVSSSIRSPFEATRIGGWRSGGGNSAAAL